MRKYLAALCAQFGICFVAALGAYLLKPIPALHAVLIWGITPIMSGISAFVLAKCSLNPYVCWIMPPLSQTLASLVVTGGYLPNGASILLMAFFGIFGAAAGENYQKIRKTKRK